MKTPCPVEGCPERWYSIEEHAARRHAHCICGWAGISLAKHIVRRRARGEPNEDHALKGYSTRTKRSS